MKIAVIGAMEEEVELLREEINSARMTSTLQIVNLLKVKLGSMKSSL